MPRRTGKDKLPAKAAGSARPTRRAKPRAAGIARRAAKLARRASRLARRLKRWWRPAPRPAKIIMGAVSLLLAWLLCNWIYQVARKPSELFFPVSGTLNKAPAVTWAEYASIFKKYSTAVMTPDLLAAIAQVEGSGNPVARTYWRWSWSSQPFEVYRPASSAVGMYQITDGNFAEARRYCIRDHAVAADGPWNDWQSCWFNSLYARVIPRHAVELTSAYLDHSVNAILERHRLGAATLQHKQMLAELIHLCGAGAGDEFARRGFRLAEGQRCGDHQAHIYLERVDAMKSVFARLER
jgi:Transglycosylase SLT domain